MRGFDGLAIVAALLAALAGASEPRSETSAPVFGPIRVELAAPDATVPADSLAFWPDSVTLTGSGQGGRTIFWDARTGHPRRELSLAWTDAILGAAVCSPDGRTLANAGEDTSGPNDVFLWDGRTGRVRRRLRWGSSEIPALAFSPDGRVLATGTRRDGEMGQARLWDVRSGRRLRILPGSSLALSHLAFLQGGRTLAGVSGDGSTRLWDVTTGRLRRRFATGATGTAGFSPDGSLLAVEQGTKEKRSIGLWDVARGKRLPSLPGYPGVLRCLAFSRDRQYLAAGGQGGIALVIDVRQGQQVHRFEGHGDKGLRGDKTLSVAFSPNDRVLVVGGTGGTLRLWDLARGRPVASLALLSWDAPATRSWVAFTPDGYFDGSPDAGRFLRWHEGSRLLAGAEARRRFRSPAMVRRALCILAAPINH